jgi:sulfotransferase
MGLKVHLISGLPRSGSTLLAALLRQNPRFVAGMTSPVGMLCGNLLQSMSAGGEFGSFFSDDRRRTIVRSVFESYYADASCNHVVFDTNRSWTGRMSFVCDLFPEARVICCVREVSWIIDSVERLVRRNALQPSRMFSNKSAGSVYSRVNELMDPDHGLVGLPWSTLREAWFSENAGRLIVIHYDSFVRRPRETMQRLYEVLEETGFVHDFDDVLYDAPAYDAQLGLPGLHQVHRKVEYRKRETCLPPDLFAKYGDVNFWLNPAMNHRRVVVL